MSKTIKETIYGIVEGVMCESYQNDYIIEKTEEICEAIREWIDRKLLVGDLTAHIGAEPLTIYKFLEELKR